jgi:hypothetical protein
MTHDRIAPMMGLAMGAMVPAMVHGPIAAAGLAFAAAHLGVGIALTASVLLVPSIRRIASRHRPTQRMASRMALGFASGFAAICIHCLVTWHGAYPWT